MSFATAGLLAAESKWSLSLFVEHFINGLAKGSIYAMLALALVVIFRSTGQLNFAQGEIGTFGAFFVSTLVLTGLPVWLAILCAMLLGFAVGAAIERVVVRPIEHRNPAAVIVALIGVFLALNQFTALVWGIDARSLPSVFPDDADDFVTILGAPVRVARLGTIGVLIVLLGLLYVLFTKTKIGLAMRAVANNQESSNLVGIRVGGVLILGWGLSGSIAVLAASLLAPSAGLTGSLMLGPFLLASVAAVLGGLDSPVGAVVGGLIIGLVDAFLTGYSPTIGSISLSSDMLFPVMLVILLGVLIFRPSGLFGSEKVERLMSLPYRVAKGSWIHWAGRAVLFGLLALFFFRASSSWSRSGLGLLTDALIIAIAVTGLNLITGYTGQLSLGHAAFFAIGAYVSAMLVTGKVTTPFFTDDIWTPGWTLPVVAVVCFAVGCVVGVPALRLKGIYLALVTIVFVEAVRSLLKYSELENITGGSPGIKGIGYLPPSWTGLDGRADLVKWFFYLALFFLVLAALITAGLLRSRMGRAMVATRDNETAAAVMGVSLAPVKTIVFGISAAIAGIAGSLYALKLTLVEPDVPNFGLFGSITLLVALVVGGLAQQWGPFVGAMFYVFVNDWARGVGEDPDGSWLLGWAVDSDTKINGLGGIVFGVLLILFARFVPFGAIGTARVARSKVVQVIPRPPTTTMTAVADGEPTTVPTAGILSPNEDGDIDPA